MQTQFDNKADIPSGEEAEYSEYDHNGKTVFMHNDLIDANKQIYQHQGRLTKLQGSFAKFESDAIEKQKVHDLEVQTKHDLALEMQMTELKDSGKTSELHKLELQQSADKFNSLFNTNEELQKNFTRLENSLLETSNKTLATKIAIKFVPPEFVESVSSLLMMNHIKNVDGKSIFTNASGEAVDNDMDRIIEVLKNDPSLKAFAKVPNSSGGYGGKGGNGDVTGTTILRSVFESKTVQEKSLLAEKLTTGKLKMLEG